MDSAQAAAVTMTMMPMKIRPTRCARFRPNVLLVPYYRFSNVINNEKLEALEMYRRVDCVQVLWTS